MFNIPAKDAEQLLNALKTEVADGNAVVYLSLYCEERKMNPDKPFAELWDSLPDIVITPNNRSKHCH